MAKVREVLSSLDIKVYSSGRTNSPQETKREECDRRFVGSVWSVRIRSGLLFWRAGLQIGIRAGPDGFTIAVFQDCWDVIKEDLLDHCLYNIITKVLSGRLRGVLHETIHSTQGAFVQGRQILDAILIANEIVDEKRRLGKEGVVFKIDFEKAYDHVNWDFLDHVLEKKGFSPRWRTWMRGCLSMVSYAILVNGNAKGWVKATRG
ncbi:hypothetical protein CK203_113578 [Vitis vinifera]|uniref:Reverse transcriptase domain-containing protein n=1 Tax=Vitis vinifera TaxID=29760 RepID=A0A438D1F5_VITVI|nr:hypothetical protein CK203_113578 [Vitis vinifera]